MTRLSKAQRDRFYPSVIIREIILNHFDKFQTVCNIGEYCRGCGREVTKEEEPDKQQGILDCIDNSGDHSTLTNLQLLCKSCNAIKNPRQPIKKPQFHSIKSSREKIDSEKYQPAFLWNLETYLQDNEEACLEEVLMNSKNLSGGGGRTACERYLSYEIITHMNKKAKFQTFPFDCSSEFCKGKHICLTGMEPNKLITKERNKLKHQWETEYNQNRKKWDNHASFSFKPFMELEEFLTTHGTLINYNFV